MIARMSDPPINLYVHLPSLQEDYKRIANGGVFASGGEEKSDAALFSLWPHRRGGRNERPDADAYLRISLMMCEWKIVSASDG